MCILAPKRQRLSLRAVEASRGRIDPPSSYQMRGETGRGCRDRPWPSQSGPMTRPSSAISPHEHPNRRLRDHWQQLHRRLGWARRIDRLALLATLRRRGGIQGASRRTTEWPRADRATCAARKNTRFCRGETGILETRFGTASGSVTIIEFMPPPESDGQIDLIRLVRGDSGHVRMHTEIILRFDAMMRSPFNRSAIPAWKCRGLGEVLGATWRTHQPLS